MLISIIIETFSETTFYKVAFCSERFIFRWNLIRIPSISAGGSRKIRISIFLVSSELLLILYLIFEVGKFFLEILNRIMQRSISRDLLVWISVFVFWILVEGITQMVRNRSLLLLLLLLIFTLIFWLLFNWCS